MAEPVYAADLKSAGRKALRVRVPLSAPNARTRFCFGILCYTPYTKQSSSVFTHTQKLIVPSHAFNSIPKKKLGGFQIIEIVVTIGLLSIFFIVLLSVKSIVQLQQNSYNTTVARQLIVEESEALRNASFASITNRTSQPFMEVAYNVGSWKVGTPQVACPSPCSGSRAYTVNNVSGSNDPSRQVVPAGRLGDGTYDFHFRPQTGSTFGWKAGTYIRYHDSGNYYLLQATATTLSFSKVVSGTSTAIWSVSRTFANSWYELMVVATGSSFAISVDGTLLTTQTDTAFSSGQYLLGAFSGAIIDFDDVKFTNAAPVPATLTWNFDDATETVGDIARGWRRLGPADLVGGTTLITVSDAQSGFTDLKQIVLTVRWTERDATRSVTNTFFVNQQSIAP